MSAYDEDDDWEPIYAGGRWDAVWLMLAIAVIAGVSGLIEVLLT